MKVRLPYVVQDQVTAAAKGMKEVESFDYDATDDTFLDGPVSRRVAVLDFDEQTGELRNGVRFEPPGDGRTRGRYVANPDPRDRSFQNVSVFSTVLKTMRAFESEDVLGRRLRWAFDGPQLLVVPRAGDWANAFYERESRSLQFFQFHSDRYGRTIYTSLSHDIVAHETGHAILDGIHPDLYDATSPEALGLHEAIADLTALVMSLDSGTLRRTVLEQSGGRIDGITALSAVAEEFGRALDGGGLYLRSLWNSARMDSRNIDPSEPHDVSQVLSGALFRVLNAAHEKLKDDATTVEDEVRAADEDDSDASDFRASGKALWSASRILRRMMFRALDYLPPGEISFADYGRAIWAADAAANPDHPEYRRVLAREFARRRIVRSAEAVGRGIAPRPVWRPEVDLDALHDSDWSAYDFVNRERGRIGIPDGVPFRVLPRLDVTKKTWRGESGAYTFRELILKVAWEREEADTVGAGLPDRRAVRAGATLVIDRNDGRVRSLLRSDGSAAQRGARTRYLRRLVDEGLLDPRGGTAVDPGSVDVDVSGGVLRVQGAGRSLHLAHGGDHA